jgi:hypothetical protein
MKVLPQSPKVAQILSSYVATDFEYDNVTHVMLAASFVNNFGRKKVYLNSHSEIALLDFECEVNSVV